MAKLQLKKKARAGEDIDLNSYKDSNALLSDMIMNYRTVISFGEKNIEFLIRKYELFLKEPYIRGRRMAHINGVLFGFSQFMRFGFIGFIFYIGAKFILDYPDDNAESVFAAI